MVPVHPADSGGGVDWAALPEPVRARLADVAARAVGSFPAADVPSPLRRLARFAPTKRARLAAGPLLAELRASATFRAAVLAWWDEHQPGELNVAAADPLAAAAAAVLLGGPDAAEQVAAVAARMDVAALRAERDAALARIDKLSAELERLRAELAQAGAAARAAQAARDAELTRLRVKVREQGSTLRRTTEAALAAETELAELRSSAARELEAALVERDRERARTQLERSRAQAAAADASSARQAAREARQADEVRLELLTDTLSGAVAGLRRELALGGTGPRPADLVRGASESLRSGRINDPAGLDRLLSLPAVHLVVDGYNVSKTGYPELTLADQRDRLVGQLAALASRTGAEVTVVFDGAGVVVAPVRAPRGVRVLFSDPSVLADDVIRDLVAAEPAGRPVVVATTDRAVSEWVHRHGAHPLSSAVLLSRLTRT